MRKGNVRVLLVVDMQTGVLKDTWNATNWCIRATAYGALDRGYDLTLIEDAHTTETIDLEDGKRIDAENIVRELNIVMKWLRYPGRTSRSEPVASIHQILSGTESS